MFSFGVLWLKCLCDCSMAVGVWFYLTVLNAVGDVDGGGMEYEIYLPSPRFLLVGTNYVATTLNRILQKPENVSLKKAVSKTSIQIET